jgi:hypothetical protein
MYFDMMPHVVATLGWLPNSLARNVSRFFLHLPDTPDVIKQPESQHPLCEIYTCGGGGGEGSREREEEDMVV